MVLAPATFGQVSGSPVADAAMHGDTPALRALLQKKTDVNAAQPDGATAIQWAAYRNDLDAADLLIAAFMGYKAKDTAPEAENLTPLERSIEKLATILGVPLPPAKEPPP